jgi:glycosyltransferase involved in cell wall biosynthesis
MLAECGCMEKGQAHLRQDSDQVINELTDLLPLVSVIIPYYSQGAYIAETIASVRRQTYPNIELIVVDDGSPEDHREALLKIRDLVVHRIPNSGPPAARNYGFQQSSGEFLVFLDADDFLPDQAIENNVCALLEHRDASLAFGAVQVIDSRGATLIPDRVCFPRRNYFLMLLETNPIYSPGAAMVRRAAFEQVGRFKDLRQFQTDDYELYLQLAKKGSLCRHDAPVLRYRRHDTNMSSDRLQMLSATLDSLNRIAAEHHLDLLERLQLWHGRRRWKYEFGNYRRTSPALKSLYFKAATLWNIDFSYLLRTWLRRYASKCG